MTLAHPLLNGLVTIRDDTRRRDVIRSSIAGAALAATAFILASGSANAFVLDFENASFIGENLVHGSVIDGTYTAADSNINVNIETSNDGGGPDFAVVFDSRQSGTADPDLQDPFSGPQVGDFTTTGTNTGSDYQVTFVESEMRRPGNILIVQENTTGCIDGVCDNPDDEGQGPNSISFEFTDGPITAESLDLFDLDGGSQMETATIRLFSDLNGTQIIDTIVVGGNDIGGDRRAGRVLFTSVNPDGIENVSKITVEFSSSGATGNLVYSTPDDPGDPQAVSEPGSLALLATGAVGLIALRRRRSPTSKV